jgi:stearoyl-CoA desaturase (delta-9 desaturase)
MEIQASLSPKVSKNASRMRRDRLIVLTANLVPLCGTLLLAWDLLHGSHILGKPGWLEFGLFFLGHFLGMVGLEVGYHRYFAHRSFKAGKRLTLLLGVLGSMSFQGGVIWWVATHRRHHAHTDREGDPHSPNAGYPPTIAGKLRGLVHAHIGWMLKRTSLKPPRWEAWAQDMFRDPLLLALHLSYWKWGVLGLFIPALLGGLWHGSWQGAAAGLVWGGLLRVFTCNQLMYATNSLCHTVGSRMFKRTDGSRNLLLLSLPSIGLSLHNNHHAFPGNARLDFRWWQPDLAGWLILSLAKLNLVSHLNTSSPQEIELKRQTHQTRIPDKETT